MLSVWDVWVGPPWLPQSNNRPANLSVAHLVQLAVFAFSYLFPPFLFFESLKYSSLGSLSVLAAPRAHHPPAPARPSAR